MHVNVHCLCHPRQDEGIESAGRAHELHALAADLTGRSGAGVGGEAERPANQTETASRAGATIVIPERASDPPRQHHQRRGEYARGPGPLVRAGRPAGRKRKTAQQRRSITAPGKRWLPAAAAPGRGRRGKEDAREEDEKAVPIRCVRLHSMVEAVCACSLFGTVCFCLETIVR